MKSAYKYIAVVYPGLFVRVGRGMGFQTLGHHLSKATPLVGVKVKKNV